MRGSGSRDKGGHLFPYEWRLADGFPAAGIPYHGTRVFSCFAGGGGSSMGYKLAGYDVVGCCEIDPRQVALYTRNLKPRLVFQDDIRKLAVDGVPDELRDLDVLDGSPPCTLFSIQRNKKEKLWGKKKKFREGQTEQVLDDLFFWFIDAAQRLRPKVVVAENVRGMLVGNSKKYVGKIIKAFEIAGYGAQFYLLYSDVMGIAQIRPRVFFLAVRNDLLNTSGLMTTGFIRVPMIDVIFNEKWISFKSIMADYKRLGNFVTPDFKGNNIMKFMQDNYDLVPQGGCFKYVHPKGNYFSARRLHLDAPVPALMASFYFSYAHPMEKRALTPTEYSLISSFPLDYDYMGEDPYYVMGMSVPPVMMAQVANRVRGQWLDKINAKTGRER